MPTTESSAHGSTAMPTFDPSDGPPTGPNPSDLSDELRELWRTRPVRTPDDRKIAGVCGGIGRRYGVDPVLARVAFVVAAFCGGAGVFLYSLSWLLLRSAGDEVSPAQSLLGRGRAHGSKFLTIVLMLVAVASMPTFGGSDSTFVGAGILATVALLAGWYGLYRHRPVPPAGWEAVSAPGVAAPPSGTTTTYPGAAPKPAAGEQRWDAPAPPHWDPLGAAPFAWDLPEPGQAPVPAPKRPRSTLTPVTLLAALVATGVCFGLAHVGGVSVLTAPRIGAVALGVVGVGLLVGSVLRRGHGLLVVAGPLAGFVLLSAMAPTIDTDRWNHRDLAVTVTDPVQLDAPIVNEVGQVSVDLGGLVLDRDRTLTVTNDVGEVRVTLPAGLDAQVRCTTDVGATECPSGLDVGRDGRGGPVLTLDVHTDVGSLAVTR